MATLNQSHFIPTDHELLTTETNLKTGDFLGNLYKESTKQCINFLGVEQKNNLKICQREMMIASSCVLLKKSNVKIGDLRDNVGDCKYEIQLTQKNLNSHYANFPTKKMDKWLNKLSFSIDCFV